MTRPKKESANKFKRLKHSVSVQTEHGNDKTFFLFGHNAYSFDQDFTAAFRLHRTNGLVHDLPDAGTRVLEPKAYAAFINECEALGLLFKPSKDKALKPKSVTDAIGRALAMWKPLTIFHPLFSKLENSPSAFAFYLLEQTYYVSKAGSYLRLALKSAKTAKVRAFFKQLVKEEEQHYLDLLRSLKIEKRIFAIHDADPGTHALLSHLHFLALTDPESLLISLSIFEASEDDTPANKSFYLQHERDVDYDPVAFIGHVLEDVGLGHSELWKTYLTSLSTISSARAGKWIADLHLTKHMIELWYDSLERTSSKLLSKVGQPISPNSFIRPMPEWGSV